MHGVILSGIYLFEIVTMAYATERLLTEMVRKLITYDLGQKMFPRTITPGIAT